MRVTNASQVKPGDEVRVSYTAKVSSIQPSSGRGDRIYLSVASRETLRLTYLDSETVELVEPDYEHEGVYLAADKTVYQFDNQTIEEGPGWWIMGGGWTVAFDIPVRPLVRLVPEA